MAENTIDCAYGEMTRKELIGQINLMSRFLSEQFDSSLQCISYYGAPIAAMSDDELVITLKDMEAKIEAKEKSDRRSLMRAYERPRAPWWKIWGRE